MEYIMTERLVIRRFTRDDWQDLYEYLSNKKLVFYEPYDVFSEDACKEEANNNKVIGNL